jgi:predicted nucleic acid-binding protein
MIVVFDTNVWLSHLGLRSPAASGVRFFLKHNDIKVALPEVVRLEVEINLRSNLMAFIEEVRNSHAQLLTAFRELPKIDLPSESAVEALIPELFSSLGVNLIEIPFSLTSARSS